jgi:hypothetical protein
MENKMVLVSFYYRTRLIGLFLFMNIKKKVFLYFYISFAFIQAQQIYPYFSHKTQQEFGVSNETYFQKEFKQDKRRVYSDNFILSPGFHYHIFRKILINNPKYSHRGMHFILAGMGFKLAYLPVIKDLYVDRLVDVANQTYKDTVNLFSNRTIRFTPSFYIDHTKDIGGSYRIRLGLGIEHHAFDFTQNKNEINNKTISDVWSLKPFNFSLPNFSSESINLKFRFTVDRVLDYDHYMGFGLHMAYGQNRRAVNGLDVLKPLKVMVEWHYGIFGK